jgi:HEAT repeat protein
MNLKNLTGMLKAGPVQSRIRAARQLGKIKATERIAVKALIRAVEIDEVAEVRSAAVKSLGMLKDPVAIRPVAEALAQDRLDWEAATNTLQAFGDQSFGPLAAAHLNSQNPYFVIKAGEVISEQKLLRALEWKDPQARAYAAILLGQKSSMEALSPLTKLLKDPSHYVRNSAAVAITQIESQTPSLSESILSAQLSSRDWQVREAVLKVIPNMELRLAWPLAMKYVTDPDFRVRAAAADAIDNLIHRWRDYQLKFAEEPQLLAELDRLVDTLAGKLSETETPDNYRMARALVGVRSAKTARVILQCLSSDDAQLRAAMAEALREGIGETNTNQPGSWLQIGEYSDGSLHIDTQTQDVAMKLIQVAHDPYEGVRMVAVAALEKMREKISEAESGYAPPVQPGTNAVAHPEKLTEAIKGALQEAKPVAPRYADASFYNGGKQEQHRVPDTAPLVVDKWYFFEVAVRMRRRGVQVSGKDSPFREPRQQKLVKLLVTLEADGFDVPDAVQELTLPPDNDSTENAWFQVRPQRRSTSRQDLSKIRVRMFYQLNLLEVFTVEAEIAGKADDPAQLRIGPRWLNQESLQREYTDFDDVVARRMHIEVRRLGANYQLTFTLGADPGPELALTAATRLKATDLEDAIERFRRKFESLATSETYLQGVKGKRGEFQNALHDLAKMGRSLWTSLFSAKPGGALDVISQRLQQQPLPDGSMIQVSVQEEAGDFLFPWSLLYDRTVPDAAFKTDPKGFWGLRYPIEQRIANIRAETDSAREVDDRLRLLFMLWKGFRNTESQIAMMNSFKKLAGEKLEISEPPVTSRDEFYRTAGVEAHILYFYTHGHTRRRLDNTDPAAGIKEWAATRYKELPQEAQKQLKSVYDAIVSKRYEVDSSWIDLTDGTLYLEEMRDRIRFLPGRPLVILNMCESAQVAPTLADSFVEFFLDRNACAVIGTECPMTVEFAHPFGQQLLKGVLAGRPVGEVLVETRRHFVNSESNPLGLAYTLFGSAAAKFVPPRLPQTNNEQPNTKEEYDE